VLRQLLSILTETFPPTELERLARETGRRLAPSVAGPDRDLRDRAAAGAALIGELGGLAELEDRDGRYVLRGFRCPFSDAVPGHPEVCAMTESLLGEAIGAPVHHHCDPAIPQCEMEIDVPRH
jgi:predicted ArsR family transcriptional regulator